MHWCRTLDGVTRGGCRGLVIAACLALALPATAEESAEDFLTIEELLDTYLDSIGVTAIHHTHDTGEVMLGYSRTTMRMDGTRDGSSRRSDASLLQDFMVAPTDMDMEMHMLHAMWGVDDNWTVMAMVPYTRIGMDHVTRTGQEFTTRAHGVGDLELGALYAAFRGERDRVVLKGGFTVPTGSIRQEDDTPMGEVRLPYPMQLGSGTVDLTPGLTYLGQTLDWSWGAHLGAKIRTGRNGLGYRLGHAANASLWAARKFTENLSDSVRVEGREWGNVRGSDDRLDPLMAPTADPAMRGGRRIDLLLGINLFAIDGPLAGNRLSLEGGIPIHQSLRGPQLEVDWRYSLAWQRTF